MSPGNKERSEIPQKSGHKVPMHETVPSVNRVRVCLVYKISEIKVLQTELFMSFHNNSYSMEILYLCGISQFRLITVEGLKTAVRDCFNDFQPSTWMMSR
jgi:hypothetical protein